MSNIKDRLEGHVPGSSPALGLIDSGTGQSVRAYKMFDASKLCPRSSQCVIKYAKVKRGTIAQINDWYEPNKDLGSVVHYHINEMTPESLAADIVFMRCALAMGAEPWALAAAIYTHQHPAQP